MTKKKPKKTIKHPRLTKKQIGALVSSRALWMQGCVENTVEILSEYPKSKFAKAMANAFHKLNDPLGQLARDGISEEG